MKKMILIDNKIIRFFLLFLFIIISFSCSNTSNIDKTRINPTPVPLSKVSVKPTNLIPTLPSDVRLDIEPLQAYREPIENFQFDVEIQFDAYLGWVSIDDAPRERTPFKVKLQGGRHSIEVFDSITGCYIGKKYYIDKNTLLDLTGPRGCRPEATQ